LSTQRLQKILAQAGVASRRHSETLILEGRITVNGEVIKELGAKADPQTDAITVDGRRIEPNPVYRYFLLNKPRGVLSTCYDPEGRKTVLEYVPFTPGLHPVGRLDRDTSGLLILSNDGAFTEILTHPRHGVPKTYLALLTGKPGPQAIETLRKGVRLEGGLTRPTQVEVLERRPDSTLLAITLKEGRNRQIRRMAEAVGHPVLTLERVAIGELSAVGLQAGKCRPLTQAEIHSLKRASQKGKTDGEP
jgi:23S rRNA pseudouridine2605 synthase